MMKPASLRQGPATTNTECNQGERISLLSKDFPHGREEHLACLACFQPSPKLSHCRAAHWAHPDPALCAHPGPSPTWIWVLRFFSKRTHAQWATLDRKTQLIVAKITRFPVELLLNRFGNSVMLLAYSPSYGTLLAEPRQLSMPSQWVWLQHGLRYSYSQTAEIWCSRLLVPPPSCQFSVSSLH